MNAFNRLETASLLQAQSQISILPAPEDVLDIIMNRRFGVAYKPIIEVQSGEVSGYQATARFWNNNKQNVNAGAMFDCLHKNPLLLFHTELEMKKLQLAHAPKDGMLMLDLDIDSFHGGSEHIENPFLALFKQHAWSEHELLINIVENHNLIDAYRTQRVVEVLQQNGISIALDDIGARWGMFSLSAFMDASTIRFNSAMLQELAPKAAQAMVDWLVSAARRLGVKTMMSGINSCEEFEWAKRMRVDCVQGKLFARNTILRRD